MRLGRIGYINCYPVYRAMDLGIVPVEAALITGTPSELNGLLAAGELEVSVISAVEYARDADNYMLLPDLAVSCDGPVRSVVLFARRPVERLDGATVLVSAASRTSVHLLRLLAQDVWGVALKHVEARTEAADLAGLAELPHEAVLVIGDAALLLAAEQAYPYRYDLGDEWKRWTGLPFVFAVWAARRGADAQGLHRALLASREWGLAHLDELAAEAVRATRLPFATCREYLSGIDYALSYRHLEGLTSFFRRLAARGLVRDGTLRFLSVA
jgi:chorismate dehydratase